MRCRAYELKPGYTVELNGLNFRVSYINDTHIILYNVYERRAGHKTEIGKRSQQWVKLIDIVNPVERRKKYQPVMQLDKDGYELNRFESVQAAELATGIKQKGISQCLMGFSKSSGGFGWKRISSPGNHY